MNVEEWPGNWLPFGLLEVTGAALQLDRIQVIYSFRMPLPRRQRHTKVAERSREEWLDDVAVDVGQTEVAAAVTEGELLVVEAE